MVIKDVYEKSNNSILVILCSILCKIIGTINDYSTAEKYSSKCSKYINSVHRIIIPRFYFLFLYKY